MNEGIEALLGREETIRLSLPEKGASAEIINKAIVLIDEMSKVEELDSDAKILASDVRHAIAYTNKRENILDIGCMLLHDISETESKYIKDIAYTIYLMCQDILKDIDRTDCKDWWESVKLMASELYKYSKIGTTDWYNKGEREYHPYHVILEDAINSEEHSITYLERVITRYTDKYIADTDKGLFVNADRLLWYMDEVKSVIKSKKFNELKSGITDARIKLFTGLSYYIETYNEMMKDEFFKGKVDGRVAEDIELFENILNLYGKSEYN